MIAFLAQEPIPTIVGLATAFVLGALFYRLALRDPQPAWDVSTRAIIGRNATRLNGLDVRYQNQSVSQLTTSTVTIWNAGRGVLDRAALATANPLRIEAQGDARILAVEVVATTHSTSQFSVEIRADGRDAKVSFEYLNPGWGGSITIIHTGTADQLLVAGDVKGVSKLRRRRVSSSANVLGELAALAMTIPFSQFRTLRTIRLLGVALSLLAATALAVMALNAYVVLGRVDVLALLLVALLSGGAFIDWLNVPPRGLSFRAPDLGG